LRRLFCVGGGGDAGWERRLNGGEVRSPVCVGVCGSVCLVETDEIGTGSSSLGLVDCIPIETGGKDEVLAGKFGEPVVGVGLGT
jgi:hypothetical protein